MILKLRNTLLNRCLFYRSCALRCNINCMLNRAVSCRRWVFEKKFNLYGFVEKLPKITTSKSLMNNSSNSSDESSHLSCDRKFSSQDDYFDFEHVDDLEDKCSSYKDLLYPDSKDPITNKLKEVTNVQQVFDIVLENVALFNGEHCGQTVLALWDLQKQCRRSTDVFSEVSLYNNELFKSYVSQLKSHDTFLVLLDLINKNINEMSSDALSCSILYFIRMNVGIKHCVLQKLIFKVENLLSTLKPGEFPVTALSRFILSLGSYNRYSVDLQNKLSLTKTLHHVKYCLDHCDSSADYKAITICIHALSSIMTQPLLNDYHNLTVRMIESNVINDCITNNISAVIKAISVLGFYDYSSRFDIKSLHETVVTLMTMLIGQLDKITYFQQFFRLQKTFLMIMEPMSLESELKNCCSHWVEKSDLDENELSDVSPELLYCLVVNTLPYKQHRYTDAAINMANKTDSIQDLLLLSTGHLKPLINLNKHLWPKFLNKLNEPLSKSMNVLQHISMRYMDHYLYHRDKVFEKKMIELLLSELNNTSAFHEPNKLSQLAMFILSFAEHIKDRSKLSALVEQLLSCMHQFSEYDCLCISRGFKQMLSRYGRVSHMFHLYAKLDTALTNRILELVDHQHLPLHKLNMLLRSFISRNGSVDSWLFQKIVERYKFIHEDEVTSRSLRNTVYNMTSTNCLVPELLYKFCDYIVKNKDLVLGSTVCKLLFCIYSLGHSPQNDSFLKIASDIVVRDIDNLNGFVLIQAALALSFYSSLDTIIVKHIFSIEFLDQLDTEVKHGYSKNAYPSRVKRCLMELNRSVCLDYPECDVPWFHTKYCQQEDTASNQLPTRFSSDVYEILLEIVKEPKLIQRNAKSLYGHNIDFQLCYNDACKLVQFNKKIDQYSKLAIILLKHNDFTSGQRQLKGQLQMQQRHLEILGYNVINIDEMQWNSMYMAEPKAKLNYINDFIKHYADVSIKELSK